MFIKLATFTMISSEEIERRKPVWMVLSEMYLDTELDDKDIERIVNVFSDSGYLLAELKHIHYNEVAPVVWKNLLSVAGEWAGFDDAWLYEKIIQQIAKKNTHPFSFSIFKWYVDKMTHRYWNKITIEFKKSSQISNPNAKKHRKA